MSSNADRADTRPRHWVKCIKEAGECDVLLFVNGKDEKACGALIRAGAALAAGRQVFVVSPDALTFSHRPNCPNLSSLPDAIAAIMAIQAAEATRGYLAGMFGTNSS